MHVENQLDLGTKRDGRGLEDKEDTIMTTQVTWGETGEGDWPGKMNSLQTFKAKEGLSKQHVQKTAGNAE